MNKTVRLGENFSDTLTGIVDELRDDEAQALFLKMALDGVLRQYVRRKGFAEVAGFLRHVADHLDVENRRSMQ